MSNALRWFPAPAKLNLFLHVLGRRADGYHELQTVFRLIDRADEVGIRLRGDDRILRLDALPGVPLEQDLCWRAAHALQRVAKGLGRTTPLGADIALRKHIPVGGGLGGGSSDAATALLVLNRLWNLDRPRRDLQALALELGADVPFFVFGRNAVAQGVGERLDALALQPSSYLVLVPQVAVSTREIFSEPALTRSTKALKIPPFFQGLGRNDLEPVAIRRYPDIRRHLDWLVAFCPDARMTGSGACVFGAFANESRALEVAAELPADMHGFVTRGLEQHPLFDWAV